MTRRTLLRGLAAWPITYTYADPARRGVPPEVDLWVPPGARGAVVLVHGGAFLLGSRRMSSIRRCADALTGVGLAALALDYRLLLRGGRFDEALADVRACMDWWRSVAAEHGSEPDRLGLIGLSAGAALAAIAATEGGANAWVGVYGPYDFRRLPGRPAVGGPTRWLLSTTDPDELHLRSPLSRALGPQPTLLFHGTRDRLVPVAHSEALVAARRSAGRPVELRTADAGHGYLQQDDALAQRTLGEVAAFFAAHLA